MSSSHPKVEDHLTQIQEDLMHTISQITHSPRRRASHVLYQTSKATSPSNKALEILIQLFDLSSNILRFFKAGGSGEDPTFDFWDNCGFAYRRLQGRFDQFLECEVHNILSIRDSERPEPLSKRIRQYDRMLVYLVSDMLDQIQTCVAAKSRPRPLFSLGVDNVAYFRELYMDLHKLQCSSVQESGPSYSRTWLEQYGARDPPSTPQRPLLPVLRSKQKSSSTSANSTTSGHTSSTLISQKYDKHATTGQPEAGPSNYLSRNIGPSRSSDGYKDLSVPLSRTMISKFVGGNSQATLVRVAKATPLAKKHSINFLVCPRRDMNPNIPASPTAPGTMNFGWGKDRQSFTHGAEIAAVFTGDHSTAHKKQMYVYVGHYSLSRTQPLGPDEWLRRTTETQRNHVNTVISKDSAYEVNDRSGRQVVEERIRRDLRTGVLTIPCVKMEFVEYKEKFAADLKQAFLNEEDKDQIGKTVNSRAGIHSRRQTRNSNKALKEKARQARRLPATRIQRGSECIVISSDSESELDPKTEPPDVNMRASIQSSESEKDWMSEEQEDSEEEDRGPRRRRHRQSRSLSRSNFKRQKTSHPLDSDTDSIVKEAKVEALSL